MDEPPVSKSVLEQLLEQTGVVFDNEPLLVTKTPLEHARLWDSVIERLILEPVQ